MKLWISGEIEAAVGDAFRHAMNSVENTINATIESKNYNLPLDGWDCIAILRDDEDFEEVTKYSQKKKDMDFRLKVDYQQFKAGPQLQREKLIYQMLERSLSILKDKGLPSEGLDELQSDIKRVASEHGWS
jgi:stress-induced morphogen